MFDADTLKAARIVTAVGALIEVADGWDELATSIFTAMQCSEVEALAEVFTAADREDLALRIVYWHGAGDDDEEDEHHDLYLQHLEKGTTS